MKYIGLVAILYAASFVPHATAKSVTEKSAADLYAYEVPAPLKVGAIFGELHAPLSAVTHKPEDLVAVESDVCKRAEIHQMGDENGIMKMRQVDHVTPQHEDGSLSLEPMGYHVMMMELKKPLMVGDAIRATFIFKDGSRQLVSVPVISRNSKMDHK